MCEKESCPKCKCKDIVFEGNWTGVMVSDIYAQHFWMDKCQSCGFTFNPIQKKNRPGPIDDKRNHV